MHRFEDVKIGELFTLARPVTGSAAPTLWRKRSTRTAELASGIAPIINRPRWFYFRAMETAYKAEG